MMLHPLPPDARCPCCRKAGLAFVRQRGRHGDLYRCAAATPCKGRTLHYRSNRGACGVSALAATGHLLFWAECPGQETSAQGEMEAEYLTTRQVAERLQVSVSMVIRYLANGKLSATKGAGRWQVPVLALKEYTRSRAEQRWPAKSLVIVPAPTTPTN